MYKDMLGVLYGDEVIPGRRAGSGVGKHNAENPKQTAKSQTLLRRRSTLPWKIASYTSIVSRVLGINSRNMVIQDFSLW